MKLVKQIRKVHTHPQAKLLICVASCIHTCVKQNIRNEFLFNKFAGMRSPMSAGVLFCPAMGVTSNRRINNIFSRQFLYNLIRVSAMVSIYLSTYNKIYQWLNNRSWRFYCITFYCLINNYIIAKLPWYNFIPISYIIINIATVLNYDKNMPFLTKNQM